MGNLLSSDFGTNTIYQHDGFSTTILDSFSSPSSSTHGLSWDGTNLISGDDNETVYQHDGFSSTILDSFSLPGATPVYGGITHDGTNVYTSDNDTDLIQKHSGFSSTVTDSFTEPGAITTGLTWDGTDMYIQRAGASDIMYQMDGFSDTVLDSFTAPSSFPVDIVMVLGNLYSTDHSTDLLYEHDGFSSTISSSIASPGTFPGGISWDDLTDRIGVQFVPKIYIY